MSNQLYIGDTHTVLRRLGMNSAHSCITSPPYWGKRTYTDVETEHGLGSLDQWVIDVATTFDLVRNVLTPDALLWVVLDDTAVGSGGAGGDYNEGGSKSSAAKFKQGDAGSRTKGSLAGAPFLLEQEMLRRGWVLRSRVIWLKGTAGKDGLRPELSREQAAHVRRPKHSYEIVQMWSQSMDYIFRNGTDAPVNGETLSDVWLGPSAARDKAKGYKAKAPFPEWLVERMLLLSTLLIGAGECVIDPYAGACTTMKVAEKFGLDSIGIDIDQDSVRAAQVRLVDVEVM